MRSLNDLMAALQPVAVVIILIGALIWAAVRPKPQPRRDLVHLLRLIAAGLVAGIFLFALGGTVLMCAPQGWCAGTRGDAWMPFVFLFPPGLVALCYLVGAFVVRRRRARQPKG